MKALAGYGPAVATPAKVAKVARPRGAPKGTPSPRKLLRPLCKVCRMCWVPRPQYVTCSTACAGVYRRQQKLKRARERFKAAQAARWKLLEKETAR